MQFCPKGRGGITLVLLNSCQTLLSVILSILAFFLFLQIIDKIINQADIPNNPTRNRNKNCHNSTPKPWPLLEKWLETVLLGRKLQLSRFCHLEVPPST